MKEKKEAWSGILFLFPSLAGVTVFVLLPFGNVILQSFQGPVLREWIGLDNYMALWNTRAFQLAVVNTLKFEAICIPLLILLSLTVAALLMGRKILGSILKSAFLVPMAIPVASVVLLWRVLFDSHGLLNGLLAAVNVKGMDWMNTGTAFWVLVVSYIWKNLGYDIVLWMAGMAGIPDSIYEAARVDGAGSWQCFWKITLPNLKPILYTITVLFFLNSFKVFRESYLVAGDYPHESIYLIRNLFQNWFRELDFDKLSAAAVLMVLVIFLLVRLLQRIWDYGD